MTRQQTTRSEPDINGLFSRLSQLLTRTGEPRYAEALSHLGQAFEARCALFYLSSDGCRTLGSYPSDDIDSDPLRDWLEENGAPKSVRKLAGDELEGAVKLAKGSTTQTLQPLELGQDRKAILVLETEEADPPDLTALSEFLRIALMLKITEAEYADRETHLRDLESAQELMGHIVDSLPVGLYVVDRDYRIVAWNRKRETGTQGVAREDAIGRSVFDVLYRQPSERLRAELEEVFESNEIRYYEVESTASGESRFYRLTKVPMRMVGTDEVTHVITVGEDVTEQKRISERISHAEKLAALGQTAAGVMHEINNPLATIAASAEALRELSEANTEELELVSMIETEVDRCKRIARDLLAFSRPPPSEKGPVDVQETVEETLKLLRHHDRFKKLTVQREYVYDLPLIWGNSERLIQVFVALALNALDAMEDEGELRVRTEILDDGAYVGISFIDTGPGIPPSELQKIFEPFYTSKPPGKGTGLGLSICYGIINEHGGRIEVDSAIGVGSNFRVVLPTTTDGQAEDPEFGGEDTGG